MIVVAEVKRTRERLGYNWADCITNTEILAIVLRCNSIDFTCENILTALGQV